MTSSTPADDSIADEENQTLTHRPKSPVPAEGVGQRQREQQQNHTSQSNAQPSKQPVAPASRIVISWRPSRGPDAGIHHTFSENPGRTSKQAHRFYEQRIRDLRADKVREMGLENIDEKDWPRDLPKSGMELALERLTKAEYERFFRGPLASSSANPPNLHGAPGNGRERSLQKDESGRFLVRNQDECNQVQALQERQQPMEQSQQTDILHPAAFGTHQSLGPLHGQQAGYPALAGQPMPARAPVYPTLSVPPNYLIPHSAPTGPQPRLEYYTAPQTQFKRPLLPPRLAQGIGDSLITPALSSRPAQQLPPSHLTLPRPYQPQLPPPDPLPRAIPDGFERPAQRQPSAIASQPPAPRLSGPTPKRHHPIAGTEPPSQVSPKYNPEQWRQVMHQPQHEAAAAARSTWDSIDWKRREQDLRKKGVDCVRELVNKRLRMGGNFADPGEMSSDDDVHDKELEMERRADSHGDGSRHVSATNLTPSTGLRTNAQAASTVIPVHERNKDLDELFYHAKILSGLFKLYPHSKQQKEVMEEINSMSWATRQKVKEWTKWKREAEAERQRSLPEAGTANDEISQSGERSRKKRRVEGRTGEQSGEDDVGERASLGADG